MSQKGFSLLDIILVVIMMGVLGYFAIQKYFKWTESFRCAEAVHELKTLKNKIEICLLSKQDKAGVNICLLNLNVQNSNTPHFKCCTAENNSTPDNKISYLLYASRNEHDLFVNDIGGLQPACPAETRPKVHPRSGIGLCRNFDGTFVIEGWGIYEGTYGL